MSGGAAAYANTMPLYVYALVEIGPRMAPHLRTGVRRERIHLEPIGRIGVLIGRIQSSPTASESALRTHDAVVRHASRMWNALLPVRFGTIVPDERALRRLVVDRRPSLAKALACVRGRVQMTVRVFGPAPALTDDAASSIGRVKGPGTRYLRRAAAIEARLKRLPELDPLREAVKPFVRDERVERRRRRR